MLKDRRFSTYLPWLLVLLIIIVSFVVYFVGLNRYKAPPGCDYGNYLTQVEILRGNDLRGWGLRHNPVFFVVLDVFLMFFEEFLALKVVAALIFSVVAVPFFLLARKLSGSNLVSVICTWLFVFFISNSEMISWGGNPNMLGFFFMLFTLFFFVDLMDKPSKKNLLLSGFFLSLVVGTHILVAIYLVFSFFIFLIATTWANKGISKVRIKSLLLMILIGVVFSLPYVSFYLSFFSNSAKGMVEITLLSMQIPQLTFDSILALGQYWQFFVVAIVFALGLFALSRYLKEEHKNNGLLLCSLFLSPLVLALITDQPIRWVYFVPIPLTLCFGIYLRDLLFDIKHSKTAVKLLAICFIAIIGFQTTVMMLTQLRSATEVYQFIENDELQMLNWIKENTAPNTILATSGLPKGDIGGGGNSYSWWIEGYCTRICICSGDLKYYSYQREQDQVRLANRIFGGTYSAEYDNLRVTEAYPSSSINPKISAFLDKDYQEMFALNDGQHQLFFSQDENEQNLSTAAFCSENRTSSIKYGDTWANITVTYELPNFELTRSVIMGEEDSSVDVIFQILPKDTTLELFKVNLWTLFETVMEDCEINNDYTVSISRTVADEEAQAQIMVLETDGKVKGGRVLFSDLEGSAPVISYSFEPLQESLYVRLRISIDTPTEDTDNVQGLNFYDSYDLLKELQIDYIVLNKNRSNEFQRFLFDNEHFTEVFQNYSISIFKVS
jgi:hypothetical protein